ncbi:L,D-transpeptidase [Iamia sp.]|uniref:L,D-transpeptidase n=1 Tax=Iamia sp. TaxID=2722710 RepID=UPI002BADD89D|nr:L,D-transpeptidase [Iamia sp.]HXH55850.1 L,D-transpeptidase [Iamia sp.]
MNRPEPTRRTIALTGGGFLAVVLVVATALSCTRSEPELGPAASRPTTTTTIAATTPSTVGPIISSTTAPTTTNGPTTNGPTTNGPTTDAPSTNGPTTATTTPTTGTTPRASSDPVAPAGLGLLPARTSEVATVRSGVGEVTVYDSATGAATDAVDATGDYGQPQVFLVLERSAGRLHVLLPVRPNGSQGWIDEADVDVATHDYQIQVSLSEFRMLVQQGDRVVIDTAIGVGTQDTPTVGGDFYTWVLLDPTNAGYGSYAYGLSGFSTLEQFAGGDGRMGIHGTADDSSIGRNVSRGCVRIPDDVVVAMVEDVGLPLGVPVSVQA